MVLQVLDVLAELRQRVPQWEIDGPDNIWILKPGGKSRGRGIHCFNNLAKLRHQVLLCPFRCSGSRGAGHDVLPHEFHCGFDPCVVAGRVFLLRRESCHAWGCPDCTVSHYLC